VDVDHSFIEQMFEEEVKILLKSTKERLSSKKRTNPSRRSISNFFSMKDIFKKKDVSHKEFLKDLGLLIVKNNLPI